MKADFLNKNIYLLSACIIILLSFLIKLYYASIMPIHLDEAYTFLEFTKKGILTSMSYYPAPNNHILHSILTNITYYLPFGQTINLRLPSLIINTGSALLFFYVSSKLINKKVALFLLSIYCFLTPVMYYGYVSRGYSLILFSFIVCYYYAIKILETSDPRKNKKNIFYFSVGLILGLYTMPSFLYAFLATVSFLLFYFIIKKDILNLFSLVVGCLFIIIITIILYAPIFITTETIPGLGNRFTEQKPFQYVWDNLYSHFSITSTFFFNIPLVITIGGIILFGIFLVSRKHKPKMVFLSVYCILISPYFIVVQSVIPFARTWIYLIIPCLFLFGLFLEKTKALDKLGKWSIIITISLVMLLYSDFSQRVIIHERFSYEAERLANLLVERGAKKVYTNHLLAKTNLAYIFEEENAKIDLISKNSLGDAVIKKNFFKDIDFLVMRNEVNTNNEYKLIQKLHDDLFVYQKNVSGDGFRAR